MRITGSSMCFIFLTLMFVGCTGGVDRQSRYYEGSAATPAQEFDMLDPYGRWISLPGEGDVWRPNEPADWSPYRNGEWEWTDRGWMWISDEQFGWVVYHYGNWNYDDYQGWYWIPGYDWSPARVSWIASDEVIGWAPLPPNGRPFPRPDEDRDGRWWSFVDSRDFVRPNINGYRHHDHPQGVGAPGNNPPDVRSIGRTRGEDVPQFHTESQPLKLHGRQLQRVDTRSNAPLGGSAPPPPSNPPQQPTDLPIGRKRGDAPTPPTPPNTPPPSPPVRTQPLRPVNPPVAPLPPPPPKPPVRTHPVAPSQPVAPPHTGGGRTKKRDAAVRTGTGVAVDTVRAPGKQTPRPGHTR